MNALDQTKTPELISKIAAMANACKEVFPRAETTLSPFTEDNMGDKWDEYVENSQNTVDLAIKTKSGIFSIYVVTKDDDMEKCDFVVIDYVSDNLRYVWEAEFDFHKKSRKDIMLTCKENGTIPSYLRMKINELCGKIFYIFDPAPRK